MSETVQPAAETSATVLSKTDAKRLADIVAATKGEVGYGFATPKSVKKLVDAGLVLMNNEITNPNKDGEFAVKATDEAISSVDAGTVQAAPAAPRSAPPTAGEFEIITERVEMPAATTRGRSSGYPFDKLEVGQSFFVPATASRPDPVKSLSSTISGTNKKYRDAGQPNKFRHAAFERNGVKGALVQREA